MVRTSITLDAALFERATTAENRDLIRRLNSAVGELSPEERMVLAAMKQKHGKIVTQGIRRRSDDASEVP